MYRGAIIMGASFYLDDNNNLKVEVELNDKGTQRHLTMDVEHVDSLHLEALIQKIYEYNFKRE